MLFPITPSNPSIPLIWENFSCLPILYESELIKTSSFSSFLLLRLLLRACFLSPSFFMWNGNLWGRNVLRSRRCCVLFLSASLPLLQASHLTFLLVSLTPIQVPKVKIPRSHLNRHVLFKALGMQLHSFASCSQAWSGKLLNVSCCRMKEKVYELAWCWVSPNVRWVYY